jgi:SNF2 family DNA or RNA helicase
MGLAWMQKMEESKNKGGILADEMGLGKTIQRYFLPNNTSNKSIALLVTRSSDDQKCRTTLICTPVALLRQWYNEIQTKTSPPLNIYIHHSSSRGKKAKTSADLLSYDVVLTTYTTIAHEWKAYDKYEHADPPLPGPKPSSLFLNTKWFRIILDESQVIKNRNTQTARAAHHLTAIYRWSLSGTPMQNGVDEMYSQFAFLRLRPYGEWKSFYSTFVQGFKRANARTGAMTKFQAVLKAILLRRTKTSKIDGVEILKGLPGKTIEMVHAIFGEEQLEFYQGLETGAIMQMKKYQAAGTLGRNFGNALVLLLRLRQACLHPKLIKDVKKAGSTELTAAQQISLAKEFGEQTVLRIKAISTFECPICFETILNPSLVLPCGHHVPPILVNNTDG